MVCFQIGDITECRIRLHFSDYSDCGWWVNSFYIKILQNPYAYWIRQKCNSSLGEVLHFQYFLSSHLSIRFNQFLHIPNLPLCPKLLGQYGTKSTN
jgi:hypothetical protein